MSAKRPPNEQPEQFTAFPFWNRARRRWSFALEQAARELCELTEKDIRAHKSVIKDPGEVWLLEREAAVTRLRALLKQKGGGR